MTLSSTLPAICIDKVVRMETGGELCCTVYPSPRLPRVTLAPNSQHAQKDVLTTDTSKSDDRENEVHKHRKTCGSNRVDFRIPGTPHSTVELKPFLSGLRSKCLSDSPLLHGMVPHP